MKKQLMIFDFVYTGIADYLAFDNCHTPKLRH